MARTARSAAVVAENLEPLVIRMRERDEAALAAFYDATISRAFSVALRITRDHGLAEEVTEDAYLQTWEDAARCDATRGNPVAWLIIIVRSRALDALRKRREETGLTEDEADAAVDASPDPCDLLNALQEHHALAQAMATLKPVARQLLACGFFRGMSHQEIADAFALPLGTVKSTIRLSLQALRRQIGEERPTHCG